MWLLKALRRLILPLPVARKRLAAALRVLSFGIDLRVLIKQTISYSISNYPDLARENYLIIKGVHFPPSPLTIVQVFVVSILI